MARTNTKPAVGDGGSRQNVSHEQLNNCQDTSWPTEAQPPRRVAATARRLRRPEQEIHKAVAAHLRQRGVAGLVWWHTPNGMFAGGKRTRKGISIQGAILKSLGVRAGVSDIICVHDSRIFALEIKAPGARPTEAQLEFIAAMEGAGAFCCVAEGLDRALACLSAWGLLKGEVQ
jgi:hypothetical protein